jgi:hypothetical protein
VPKRREVPDQGTRSHFELVIGDDSFGFSRKHAQISAEPALDGIYVVQASPPAPKAFRRPSWSWPWKDLKFNEAGVRNLKTIDLDLGPIYRYSDNRVRAHVLICMLALYVVWHLRNHGSRCGCRRGAT